MADGGFFDLADNPSIMVFTDSNGHIIMGLFMVDGVLYQSTKLGGLISKGKYETIAPTFDSDGGINYYLDSGKVLDGNGKPFAASAKIYSIQNYIPKYDSKGNLIGAIQMAI